MTLGDQEMAERRLVCGQGRVDEERELEFDEECVAGSNIQHFRRQVCVCVRSGFACGTNYSPPFSSISSTLLTG